ncbi:MAG: DUF3798 domain-containing protein [Lachnospiraceae bacterium]|nr:DUF3798 domain-containing protein [Lachnospiraceae bacterium]
MKRWIAGLLTLILVLSLAGCGGRNSDDGAGETKAPAETTAKKEEGGSETEGAKESEGTGTENYKIGIVTGTVAQTEEDYRAAQSMKALYGEEHIVTATYPDNFESEQQQVIQTIKNMAQEPDMKAIIVCQAVPGTKVAFEAIKNDPATKDILLVAGVPFEDPNVITTAADISIDADHPNIGYTMTAHAKEMGAKTFVFYSFARHMAQELVVQKRDNAEKACEELGINFVYAECVDPMGEQGVSGAQQWILEDLPRKLEEYGDNVAFFATNCSLQVPIITTILNDQEHNSLYPLQCCPSPLHAMPEALGLEIPDDKKADVPYILEAEAGAVKEQGGEGRIATWAAPTNYSIIVGSVAYALEYINGNTNGLNDEEVYLKCMNDIANGAEITLNHVVDSQTGNTYDSYYLFSSTYVTY